MTQAVQQLLAAFDQLTDKEQHVIAIEVLRRTAKSEIAPLTDESLVELADDMFVQLDQEEDERR